MSTEQQLQLTPPPAETVRTESHRSEADSAVASATAQAASAQPPGTQSGKTGNENSARAIITRLHKLTHAPEVKNFFDSGMFAMFGVGAVVAWMYGLWPVTVLCWIAGGHFGHTKPLLFHDAAHGALNPWRFRNELWGHFYGTLILVPLSLYRHAHSLHHAYMSTEKDPELWPFTIPGTPRWLRCVLVVIETAFGFLYTPALFFRSLFCGRKVPARLRWQIAREYGVIVAVWGTALWTVNHYGVWMEFLVGYMAPVWIAGMFQTLNKYTEHLGLMGDSILTGTRTVVPHSQIGHLFSQSWQHVDYHGTHHRYARIPYYNLPAATPYVYSHDDIEHPDPARLPVYHSYIGAFWAMLKTLGNPRVGSQWLGDRNSSRLRPDPRPDQQAESTGNMEDVRRRPR